MPRPFRFPALLAVLFATSTLPLNAQQDTRWAMNLSIPGSPSVGLTWQPAGKIAVRPSTSNRRAASLHGRLTTASSSGQYGPESPSLA